MLKVVGSALLLCGSALLGWMAAHRLNERVKTIGQMLSAVQIMRRELSFALTPLPRLLELLEEQTKGPLKNFFKSLRSKLSEIEHMSVNTLWQTTMQETELPIANEERELFAQLGEVLGRYDSEGQTEFLLYAEEALERCHQIAEEERARMSKVYQVLGVTVGGFLVVLLF